MKQRINKCPICGEENVEECLEESNGDSNS